MWRVLLRLGWWFVGTHWLVTASATRKGLEYRMHQIRLKYSTLKIGISHNADYKLSSLVTPIICRFVNLRCHHWRQSWHHGYCRFPYVMNAPFQSDLSIHEYIYTNWLSFFPTHWGLVTTYGVIDLHYKISYVVCTPENEMSRKLFWWARHV